MPELFRFFGYSFFFYSREHEPIHVHVEGNDGYAVFDMVKDRFVLREQRSIKAGDIRKIKQVLEDNRDIIVRKWNYHFENGV